MLLTTWYFADVCLQPKDVGPCKAAKKRWFFNKKTGKCEKFTYGGCHGNGNNFNSKKKCKNICGQEGKTTVATSREMQPIANAKYNRKKKTSRRSATHQHRLFNTSGFRCQDTVSCINIRNLKILSCLFSAQPGFCLTWLKKTKTTRRQVYSRCLSFWFVTLHKL